MRIVKLKYNNRIIDFEVDEFLEAVPDKYIQNFFDWQTNRLSKFDTMHSNAIKRGLEARKERLAREALNGQA